MKRVFILSHGESRYRCCNASNEAPEGWMVTIEPPRRTLDQNAAQWPILGAFSKQLKWPINGERVLMVPEDWKDVLTCSFSGEDPRVSQTLEGKMVLLGSRTSQFGKDRFSDWLEFLNATAALRGIDLGNHRG